MSGDWIKMRCDLYEDPTVFTLSTLTKLDRFAVIGKLHSFWSWVDKHAVEGRVYAASTAVIDDVVRKRGFAAALKTVGWLTVNTDCIEVPNHDRHNGQSAKERALRNQRQARWRDGQASTQAPTEPSTDAYTREEKRREEKKNLNQSTKSREGANAPRAQKTRAKQLPEEWVLPDDWGFWAKTERPDWDGKTIVRVSLEFRDHWLSKGEARADWEATWRNWVRREKARAPPNGKHSLAERRTQTLDAITGAQPNERDITAATTRVDRETVHPVSVDLRQSSGDDVGPSRSGRPARNVGR